MKKSIKLIASDLKKFLLQEKEEGKTFFYKEFSPQSIAVIEKKKSEPLEDKKEELPNFTPPKKAKKENEEIPKGFSLEPFVQNQTYSFAEIEAVLSKIDSSLKKSYPICLFIFEKAEAWDFFSKVAQAISQKIASCQLIDSPKKAEELFNSSSIKVILASIVYLQKKNSAPLKLHELFTLENGTQVLPIATYKEYHNNNSLKQALWNTLKALNLP